MEKEDTEVVDLTQGPRRAQSLAAGVWSPAREFHEARADYSASSPVTPRISWYV